MQARRRRPVALRLLEKIEKSHTGCWLWKGAMANSGYGKIGLNYKTASAHRVAYTLFVGAIPEGLEIDHICKVKSCVNPSHLRTASKRENSAYSINERRAACQNTRKTHCPRGHEYSGRNSQGKRICKTCASALQRARLQRLAVEA